MNTLKFYKFIHQNGIEYKWNEKHDDVYMYVELYNLEEFRKLFRENYFIDHAVECLFQGNCVCFPSMSLLCDNLEDIFDE